MDIKPFSHDELLPAYIRVADDLRSKLGGPGFEAGQLLPGEHELSKAYNLSRGTIRKALDILAEENLISRQPGRGTVVLPPQLKGVVKRANIAVVWSIVQTSGTEMLTAIEKKLSEASCDILFSSTQHNPLLEAEILERLALQKPDGLILYTTGAEQNVELIHKLYNSGIFVVLLDRFTELLRETLSWVSSENFKGAYEMTRYLLALGHEHIAYVAWTPDFQTINSIQERNFGYEQAMQDHNLEALALVDYGNEITPSSQHDFTQKLYSFIREHRPTAIFFHNDATVYRLYPSFAEWGIRIPDDISVVGFDKLEIEFGLAPFDLTTVEQDFTRLGTETADTLLQLMDNTPAQPLHIRIPVSLHIGNTTAAPNLTGESPWIQEKRSNSRDKGGAY
jgi:GntR family transcriptional regulator, arabinose operon transcriptional repressor